MSKGFTIEIKRPGIWIVPHDGELDPQSFAYRLNPNGLCRCGENKPYSLCCLGSDARMARETMKVAPNNRFRYPDFSW